MDADIAMVPSNILQVMLKQDKPILAANCMFLGATIPHPYDLNSWIEMNETLRKRVNIPSSQFLPEGYLQIITHQK